MGAYDLTTLAMCKEWLNIADNNSDNLLGQEITRISSMVLAWLSGPSFTRQIRNEVYNGKGTQALTLRNSPVLSVSALAINGVTVAPNPTPPTGAGFVLDQWDGTAPARLQSISVNGYWFPIGRQNVAVTYITGYVQSDIPQTIPTPSDGGAPTLCPLQPQGLCVQDVGVAYYPSGQALVPVAANPAAGQYVAPNPLAGRVATTKYTFAAADQGQQVVLTYSYVPWAVEGIAKDLVSERWRYRTRIGERSKTLGGQETASFEMNVVPKWAQVMLQPFASVVPI